MCGLKTTNMALFKLNTDIMMIITSDDLDQDLYDYLTDPSPVILEKLHDHDE